MTPVELTRFWVGRGPRLIAGATQAGGADTGRAGHGRTLGRSPTQHGSPVTVMS